MSKEITLMVQGDLHVWADAESIVAYLRRVEGDAQNHADDAKERGDRYMYAAAAASSDAIRQVADGIVLACMSAREQIREKHGAR